MEFGVLLNNNTVPRVEDMLIDCDVILWGNPCRRHARHPYTGRIQDTARNWQVRVTLLLP